MTVLPNRLPVPIRLPLVAAGLIFIAAVASTQTAIFFMSRQAEQTFETLGQVYLDGLSTALLPHAREGNTARAEAVLEQALQFHEGLVDRRLLLIDAERRVVAESKRAGVVAELPEQLADSPAGATLSTTDGSLWVWRSLQDGGHTLGTVAANLDVSSFQQARGRLRWLLLLFDLAFSGGCALLGFFMVRRIQQPLATLARYLYDAALGQPRPIREPDLPEADPQTFQMFHAYNAMAHSLQEREALIAHLADRERDAVLGRLAATLAHEIRNPLGGMRTAVGTLQRFGDRPETRQEAVEFLERGVQALEQVVDATLETHRARPQWRPLTHQDFEDLRLLVAADGKARNVAIELELEIPAQLPIAALEVRQVLLNLLLNAVRASVRGGVVQLAARLRQDELLIDVKDQGNGLDPAMAASMTGGKLPDPAQGGLGVAVVIRLVERLQGSVAVEAQAGRGTRITLTFPLPKEPAAE